MLTLFRSKQAGQNRITALGVISDAALMCQVIEGADDREPYWCLRRSVRLFEEITDGRDLTGYEVALVSEEVDDDPETNQLFEGLYRDLEAHGFTLVPIDDGRRRSAALRNLSAPAWSS
jgi:Asp-tRNA(Asn)/Glu-tRNA(Gln) amidotransferase A subunit family amidase